MAMLEDGTQLEIINGNLGIYKGAIYENIIADIFHKSGEKFNTLGYLLKIWDMIVMSY